MFGSSSLKCGNPDIILKPLALKLNVCDWCDVIRIFKLCIEERGESRA